MFEILQYTVEKLHDPYGIITGDRYEFILDLQVDEEDELFSEEGISLRVIMAVDGEKYNIMKYEFLEGAARKYIALEMEDDELKFVEHFCKEELEAAE